MYFGCGLNGASASISGATVWVSESTGATEYSGVGSGLCAVSVSVVEASGVGLSDGVGSTEGSGVGSTYVETGPGSS